MLTIATGSEAISEAHLRAEGRCALFVIFTVHSYIPMSKDLINQPLLEDEMGDTGEVCCGWTGFINMELLRDSLDTALGALFIPMNAA